MSVTKYSELYTVLFSKRVSRAIQCSCHVNEIAFGDRSEFVGVASPSHSEMPEPKRRRLSGKFQPERLFVAPPETEARPSDSALDSQQNPMDHVRKLLHLAESCAPRVGKVVIQDGPLFEGVQEAFPDKKVVVIDVCRGINRMRTCPFSSKGIAPIRRSFGKRRSDLQPFLDDAWESWEGLSHRQQIRACTPSRILVTIFATNKRECPVDSPKEEESKRIRTEGDENVGSQNGNAPISHEQVPNGEDYDQTGELNKHEGISQVEPKSHGPLYQKLDEKTRQMIQKIHQNLGHPDARTLQLALKRYGWSEKEVRGSADFQCPICLEKQQPKVSRPGHLALPRDFNDHISFDAAEWQDPQGKKYGFYHFIDSATNFHVAIPYIQQTTDSLIEAFNLAWLRWAGPPKSIMFDSATEANSEKFARFLQANAISSYVIPTEAHWQLGRAERNGAVLKHMITKYHEDHPIQNQGDFEQGLIHLCNAKNAMSRHAGYTPELWVLGKMKPVPGCNSNVYMDSASYMGLEESETEGNKFQEMMSRRESARIAFVKADHSAAVRKAIHARSRPDRMTFNVGDMVMYWRAGKGVEDGAWHGPAKILMTEGNNLVWISHLTRLYRCAPEHVRRLSEDEAQGISPQELQTFQLPNRTGTGVFQFRELSTQASPTATNPRPADNIPHDPDLIIPNPPDTDNNSHNPPPSIGQPDDEPGCQNVDSSRPPTPTEEIPDPAVVTPVPEDIDDDLVAVDQNRDHWEIQGDTDPSPCHS